MTFLLQLRTAAVQCSNVDYRRALQLAADEISGRLTILQNEPTQDNMVALNGAWANAARMLREIPHGGAPDPMGGKMETPVLQRSDA